MYQTQPSLSPDGRWLAYSSNETGRFEVLVRPYDGSGPDQQVSTSGGQEPLWGPCGRKLYYRSAGSVNEVGGPMIP